MNSDLYVWFFSILAQVSRRATVRLKTGWPGRNPEVDAEVAQPLELKLTARLAAARLGSRQPREHFQRIGIEVRVPVLPLRHVVGVGLTLNR